MLGRIRGFDDDKESAVGSENGGGWASGRSELFPLSDNISEQVQSHQGAAQPRKKKSFSTLHMRVVKFKQKLWEGTPVVVEAMGGIPRHATRRARSCGHVHPHFT